jgi:hypothetical protein
MTEKQLRFLYFPAWGRAAEANEWRMERGRLVGHLDEGWGASAELRGLYRSVWAAAQEIALQDHCAVTADHLRHACHRVALGRDKSAKDLDNGELDRVVALFRILADPDDLDAVLAYSHPENTARQRMEWWIKHRCLDSYVQALCRSEYGTADWEGLGFDRLKALHMTLKHRPHAWRPMPQRRASVPALDRENAPF